MSPYDHPIKMATVIKIIANAPKINCNGKIHLTHFDHGIPATPKQAINTALVGKIAFENPSPNWKIKIDVCGVIPTNSPSGAIIGIVNAACPEPDEIKKLMNI